LRANNNRLGGRIAVYVMDFWSSFQIDEPDDVTLIEWILNRERVRSAVFPRPVKLVVFDFDGVMTDNAVYVDSEGREFVRCSRSDGLGLDALRASAIPAIVLSTEANPVVAARCKKVQLPCFQGVSDKALFLKRYMAEQNIDAKQVVYVGNDLNDLGCFEVVGCAVAVADAYPAVKSRAHIVLSKRGGDGAVRELCDLVCAS
jgi:N-acylneuraminate cytidylyltransferase